MQPEYGYGSQSSSMRQEVPILAEQGVQVTTARFVCYQQTYPIAGLTSVAPYHLPAQRSAPIMAALLFGSLALIAVLNSSVGWTMILILAAGVSALVAVQKKASYGVVVWTAGTNMRALTSYDPAFVQRVLAALNQAIASR